MTAVIHRSELNPNKESIKILGIAKGDRVLTIDVHPGAANLNCIAFSPDGTRLASAADNGTVKLWDLESDTEALSLNYARDVRCVAFSPDEGYLATACGDGVRIWNARPR